jgi:formylglycine-generating enzyme required for sulfatase activity
MTCEVAQKTNGKLMKQLIRLLSLIIIASAAFTVASANNITVTSGSLTGRNVLAGTNNAANYISVQFTAGWENSWRTSSAPTNSDAAWIFVKYKVNGNYVSAAGATSASTTITVTSTAALRVGMPVAVTAGTGAFSAGTVVTAIANATTFTVSGAPSTALSGGATVVTGSAIWEHATINTTGYTAPEGSTITPAMDGTGAFIYRSADGTGSFTATSAQLRWNYGANGVADNATVDVKVFAIEMVYVPTGAFAAGSGGTETGSFTNGSWSSGATIPLSIASENALTVANSTGNLWGTSTSGSNSIGGVGTLASTFPKGYAAFYCMKYEVSQQEYVDFLNTLTQTQANARNYYTTLYRHAITGGAIGSYATTNPYVSWNYASWADLAAYLDWSGLRPMTELEFEKACRGTVAPVANEYAWGNATIYSTQYGFSGSTAGTSGEVVATPGSGVYGNANYSSTGSTISGPLRGGSFATSGSDRIVSGATYYGIMEMSGNVFERIVTVGHSTGRGFTGTHGNGVLGSTGNADASTWPGTDAVGAGFRGGEMFFNNTPACVSDRYWAAYTNIIRNASSGGRGVRSRCQR